MASPTGGRWWAFEPVERPLGRVVESPSFGTSRMRTEMAGSVVEWNAQLDIVG
jgi:hypothetical protein